MIGESKLYYHLTEFAQLLRSGGFRVSFSEILDAIQGLVLIGLENKKRVEAVLQATLVKEENQIARFQESFRVYFAAPEEQKTWLKQAAEEVAQWEKELDRAGKELLFQGRELNITPEQRLIYVQMPAEEQLRLQDFLQKSSQGTKSGLPLDQSMQPIITKLVQGSLEYWRRKLEEDAGLHSLPPTEGISSEVERALREREVAWLAQDLKSISPDDWLKVTRLIHRLTLRLSAQISRRYHAAGRRGGIDMRRTLRRNLRYGGVLLARSYRRRRFGRPRFVVLCDFSASMLKYTEFVLQFIYGLNSVISNIETFAFGEDLVYLTDKIHKGQSFQHLIRKALAAAAEELGSGTNLAVSLDRMLVEHHQVLTRRTIFLILSDTRTLAAERAAESLHLIQRKVRAVLWLNTVPAKQWPQTPTVGLFRPYCQMFECYTLGQLTAVMSKQL
ncbi:MAG TPA: VWA domain-containing protein [Desulfitobacteriaceae bacterium]|nr:VWA domain-containing protein [Desulfitobacteriaceae bacterium]